MSDFLAPLNYGRAKDVLRRLSVFSAYAPQAAAQALSTLRQNYPLVFGRMEEKTFENGALLLELPGADITGPLVFVSHLDAPACGDTLAAPPDMPMTAPLSRAHLVALLEALEGLLGGGYRPCGDLMLAISMDGLSGGAGARSLAAHLKARGVQPCFVLDYGGYATMEAFRTYLPKNAPLALVGVSQKGEVQGAVWADSATARRPAHAMVRAAARLCVKPRRARLCPATERMLAALGKQAPLLQRWFVRCPRLTFWLMRLWWRKRSVYRQFFTAERTVYALEAQGAPQSPARSARAAFCQTLLPGQRIADCRRYLQALAAHGGVHVDVTSATEAAPASALSGESWDALGTAIEIQFERAVIVPCLSPFVTDAGHYQALCDRVYRFSPFLITGEEALCGLCTVTDGALQTAVQFFRSMLSV